MKNKILLVDGNSLLFRAYYATSYGNMMRSNSGVYTNAIFALSNMLNKILEQEEPDYVVVAFDTDKKTFRHTEFDFYKANRKSPPEELIPQFALAREMISKMGMKVYELEGYEADDIIATLAKKGEEKGLEVEVFSSDKDLLQLVSDKTHIHLIKKGISNIEVVTPKILKSEYQLEPEQVIDYKALRGDPSDNIPGVKGIGEVGALKLLGEYHTLDNIYENIENIKGKLKTNLVEGKEMAYISKKLATLYKEVPIDFELESAKYEGPLEELVSFYQEYDMNSLARRVNIEINKNFEFEDNVEIPSSFLKEDLAIYMHFEGTNYHYNELIGMGFSNGEKSYYLSKDNILNDPEIKGYLEDESKKKIVYDIKSFSILLGNKGIKVNGLTFDFKLANYLLDPNIKDDPVNIFNNYQIILPNLKEQEKVGEYCALIAYNMYTLKDQIVAKLKELELYKLYEEIELPLVSVLIDMERTGITTSKEVLEHLGVGYRFKLNSLESEIFELVGHKFNVASPKQVGEVLFDELHLPSSKKRSTSSDILKDLSKYHEVPALILEYRKYAKLLSTYIDGITPYISEDGKIHAIFNQTQTQTGRLSSSEPNMQNISIRDEESRLIRKAFLPNKEGDKIVSIDYSQVELRILASIAKDTRMIEGFKNEEDVHLMTAAAIFDLPLEMVTEDLRRQAKAVNFGIVYGISDWGLSEQIGVTPKEAKIFIEKYFDNYPSIKSYLENVVEECKEKGYVSTIFNRRREVKEINHSSYMVRESGKRIAMNTPIQGSAADIIKIAMIKIAKFLKENNYKSKMILQIHDELVFDMKGDEVKELTPKLIEIMENSVELEVKLKTSYGIGDNWYDAK